MNHWPFVIAAYAAALLGTVALVVRSWAEMRRAERDSKDLTR